MPLTRLEKVAIGLIALGGISFVGADIAAKHFKSQIKITVPVAKAKELEEKMGEVSWKVHGMFYRRDSKGYDRVGSDFLNPENRQAIMDAWREYDILNAEYNAVISYSGVKELMERNRSLRESAWHYGSLGDTAVFLLIAPGILIGGAGYLRRTDEKYNSTPQTTTS